MNRMTAAQLRESYLSFFESKAHKRIASDSLIPKSDPTVLFTGAGMMQFKANFLGRADDGLARATTCQKCVRTVDIENVGLTTRHCTFFEMLGNFSFGDYFKEEAILWAWEYVTRHLDFPEEQIWATVFTDDDEAWTIWEKEVGVPANRIRRLGAKENFWEVPNMPCGPCSEIHIDFGEGVGCGRPLDQCGPECDCDRFSELWNLVFTQFRREPDGTLSHLPKPNIDTGMGLERVAAVLQGAPSVFDTDQFRPILDRAAELSGKTYGQDKKTDISLRIIAEHARMASFCIGDHILPANVGRGYVLRRVMRRAIRHGRMLGIEGPFLVDMFGCVREMMADAYPELARERETIERIGRLEEENFSRTLVRGMNRLDNLIEQARNAGRTALSGEEVFTLYDTYGFPKDLVAEVLRDEGLTFDETVFERELEAQRERARAAWSGDKVTEGFEVPAAVVAEPTVFTGYDEIRSDAAILAIYAGQSATDSLSEGQEGLVILDRTPFYAEAGGQVADPGYLTAVDGGGEFEVTDVQKTGRGVYLHRGRVTRGSMAKGAAVRAAVDEAKRFLTVRNHTATHLLHAALRERLGAHVKQAGSLVNWERLRFDFAHFEGVSRDDLDAIEQRVNEWIVQNAEVRARVMPLDEAKATGAMALFDEKYGNEVRVVSVGEISREFCGGTHAGRAGDIGLVRILSESSISAGTRRIEAVTGPNAYAWTVEREHALAEAAGALKARPEELGSRVVRLLEQNKALEKELAALRSEKTKNAAGALADRAEDINGVRVLAEAFPVQSGRDIQSAMDTVVERTPSGVFFLAGVGEDNLSLLCVVTDDLTARFNAGQIIRDVAPLAGGKGGGKANRAQGGGTDPAKAGDILERVRAIVAAG